MSYDLAPGTFPAFGGEREHGVVAGQDDQRSVGDCPDDEGSVLAVFAERSAYGVDVAALGVAGVRHQLIKRYEGRAQVPGTGEALVYSGLIGPLSAHDSSLIKTSRAAVRQ
ncbi:hypothetical protein ACWD4B_22225 [Streptomyces sp. NPDC002536]